MTLWVKIASWIYERAQDFAGRHDVIEGLYPPFRDAIDALILAAQQEGLDVGMHQGFRSWEEQDRLYAQGRTTKGNKVTNAKGGQSWHQFGLAADVVFRVKGRWSWDPKHPWSRLDEIGRQLGLSRGPKWDLPHFEWPRKMSLARARELYKKGGLQEVWKHLG